jgi:hypothetical protein
MAYQEIPVRSDIPAYDMSVTLDGVLYYLSFEWNERGQFWTMDIYDQDQVALVLGTRMITNVDLLGKYKIAGLPKGIFLITDTSGKNLDASVDNFGIIVKLFYREDGTVDE